MPSAGSDLDSQVARAGPFGCSAVQHPQLTAKETRTQRGEDAWGHAAGQRQNEYHSLIHSLMHSYTCSLVQQNVY